MPYEWDETKRRINIRKHGIDFTQVEGFRWETAQIETQVRFGERRYLAYGYIGDRLHALAYVRRNTNIRVVSLRKANDREQDRYDAS